MNVVILFIVIGFDWNNVTSQQIVTPSIQACEKIGSDIEKDFTKKHKSSVYYYCIETYVEE